MGITINRNNSKNMVLDLVKWLGLGNRLTLDRELVEAEDTKLITLNDIEIITQHGITVTFERLGQTDTDTLYHVISSNNGVSVQADYVIREKKVDGEVRAFEIVRQEGNMGKLKFFHSSMRAGKSALALQMKHNFDLIDEPVMLLSTVDSEVSSRIGLKARATAINDITLNELIQAPAEHYIIDEAQFLTIDQVEDIAELVDTYSVNVYLFGLLTDFRGKLFVGTKRILELADEIIELQTKSLCWCGRKATHNMRIDSNGYPLMAGDITVIGEGYETLCRKHFHEQITRQIVQDQYNNRR